MNKILNKTQKSINFNKFFFELKRTPIVKRFVSDFIYDRYELKDHWFFNPYLFNNILKFFTKSLYVFILIGISALLAIGAEKLSLDYGLIDTFVLLWFFLLAIGSMNYDTNFTSETIKIYFISFQLPFENYFGHHLKTLLFDRLIYMIVMGVILFLFDISWTNMFLVIFTIFMILVYTVSKQIHYAFKYSKLESKRFHRLKANPLDGFMMFVFLACIIFFKSTITLILINTYFMFWLIVYYFKYKDTDYYEKYHHVLLIRFKENEAFLDNTSDLDVESVTIQDTENLKNTKFNINEYQGYDLFNELFVQRLSFLWEKTFKRIRLGVSVVFVVIYFALLGFPNTEEIILSGDIHSTILSMYIFFLYITEIGKRLTQAYYFNADYSLLHYPFYFERRNLWRQFIVRLKTIFRIHLYVAGPLILFTWLYTFTFPAQLPFYIQIRFTLVVLSLMMFVSLFDLALYYLMQPFTKNLNVDNKVYLTIYTLFYFTLYLISIDVYNYIHVALTTTLTVVFFIISILLVYMFSYKTFKYKD